MEISQKPRNFNTHPYSKDEERVAEYISDLTGIGGGDDPIGFLIASHQALSMELEEIREQGRDRPA